MPHTLTARDRKYLDALRIRGLRVAYGYEKKLIAHRRKELVSALRHLEDNYDKRIWESHIDGLIDESGYLYKWHQRMTLDVGMPMALSVANGLVGKYDGDTTAWQQALTNWSAETMGKEIVSVQGTDREIIKQLIRNQLELDPNVSVERLARLVATQYDELLVWQVRRIAQTESMNGMAEAGRAAADTLSVRYTKQWVCSGLNNTRDTHLAMDGVEVADNEMFELPEDDDVNSCVMRYPHDTMFNPPAGQIINCACGVRRIPY